MNRSRKTKVVIIGGGWAGLAAAVELLNNGVSVHVLESAKQLGGRARCVEFNKQRVDNGQHLLLGAYHQTLAILKTCGVNITRGFYRIPLHISVLDKTGETFNLKSGRLPAPLNLLQAIFSIPECSYLEKFKTARFLIRLWINNFSLNSDDSVKNLLNKQPEKIIRMFWEPICLAALNTGIDDASANLFLRVLRDGFTKKASDSDLMIPAIDLAQLYVHPAMQYIDNKGGQISLGKKITRIIKNTSGISVYDSSGDTHSADHVIISTSVTAAEKLLQNSNLLDTTCERLRHIKHEPICTIYLQYPATIELPVAMTGLTGCTAQWLFDRRHGGQPGLMAAVISADGDHMKHDKITLAQLVSDELSELFGWPEASKTLVIREKRATFQAHVDVDELRPVNKTDVTGLWLAGDYIAGPYPATLEGAVHSGVQCAQQILTTTQKN